MILTLRFLRARWVQHVINDLCFDFFIRPNKNSVTRTRSFSTSIDPCPIFIHTWLSVYFGPGRNPRPVILSTHLCYAWKTYEWSYTGCIPYLPLARVCTCLTIRREMVWWCILAGVDIKKEPPASDTISLIWTIIPVGLRKLLLTLLKSDYDGRKHSSGICEFCIQSIIYTSPLNNV